MLVNSINVRGYEIETWLKNYGFEKVFTNLKNAKDSKNVHEFGNSSWIWNVHEFKIVHGFNKYSQHCGRVRIWENIHVFEKMFAYLKNVHIF